MSAAKEKARENEREKAKAKVDKLQANLDKAKQTSLALEKKNVALVLGLNTAREKKATVEAELTITYDKIELVVNES